MFRILIWVLLVTSYANSTAKASDLLDERLRRFTSEVKKACELEKSGKTVRSEETKKSAIKYLQNSIENKYFKDVIISGDDIISSAGSIEYTTNRHEIPLKEQEDEVLKKLQDIDLQDQYGRVSHGDISYFYRTDISVFDIDVDITVNPRWSHPKHTHTPTWVELYVDRVTNKHEWSYTKGYPLLTQDDWCYVNPKAKIEIHKLNLEYIESEVVYIDEPVYVKDIISGEFGKKVERRIQEIIEEAQERKKREQEEAQERKKREQKKREQDLEDYKRKKARINAQWFDVAFPFLFFGLSPVNLFQGDWGIILLNIISLSAVGVSSLFYPGQVIENFIYAYLFNSVIIGITILGAHSNLEREYPNIAFNYDTRNKISYLSFNYKF